MHHATRICEIAKSPFFMPKNSASMQLPLQSMACIGVFPVWQACKSWMLQGITLADEFDALEKHWHAHDFFYLHFKKTDTCGENGDFEGKVHAIEEMDSYIPRLMALNPDVVIITGDHSSPAVLRSHSWHPVPLMLYAKYVRPDNIPEFGERTCARGSLGIMYAKDVMSLALANAGRLAKYGA